MTGPLAGARTCESCRLWRHLLDDARGPAGPCRLRVRLGDVPATAPACERYLARDAAVPSAPPPDLERPRRARGPRPPGIRPRAPAVAGAPPAPGEDGAAAGGARRSEELDDMTREELAEAIREAIREEGAEVRLANKWEGGTVVLRPGDPSTQARELPIDALLHKVVMIRDRLRVLEQKLNAHEKLSDAEKVDLQQYVTRCYGSLTSFNLLFRDEADRFVGEKV